MSFEVGFIFAAIRVSTLQTNLNTMILAPLDVLHAESIRGSLLRNKQSFLTVFFLQN